MANDQTVARKSYSTDLTHAQWSHIEPLLPIAKPGGARPRKVNLREVLNTILYLNRTGCQWDMLPHDLTPRGTTWEYFAAWRDDGTLQTFLDTLRAAIRVPAGREPTPSASFIDTQSVKTTEVGGENRGTTRQRKSKAKASFAGRYAGFIDCDCGDGG